MRPTLAEFVEASVGAWGTRRRSSIRDVEEIGCNRPAANAHRDRCRRVLVGTEVSIAPPSPSVALSSQFTELLTVVLSSALLQAME